MNNYENRLKEEYERIVKIKDSTIRMMGSKLGDRLSVGYVAKIELIEELTQDEELKKLCNDYRNEIYDTYNSSKLD